MSKKKTKHLFTNGTPVKVNGKWLTQLADIENTPLITLERAKEIDVLFQKYLEEELESRKEKIEKLKN